MPDAEAINHLKAVSDWIMTYLDPIGVVIGLIIAVPVIWTWVDVVFGRKRRRRRWYEEARGRTGNRPAILIVDLLTDKDVRTAVEHYRQGEPDLKDIPAERIVLVSRDRRLTEAHMPDLLLDIRRAAGDLIAAGADTVHYFHAGPGIAAALVGAEFSNGCRVLLYQHEPGGYRNFGPLRIDT